MFFLLSPRGGCWLILPFFQPFFSKKKRKIKKVSFIHSALLFSSTYSCRHVVVTPTHSPPSLRSKANDETTDELPLPIFDLCLFWHGHWNMRAGLYRRHMWHGWFGWLLGLLGWHCTRCILLLSAEFPHHKGKKNCISPYSFVPHKKKNMHARTRTKARARAHTHTKRNTQEHRRTHVYTDAHMLTLSSRSAPPTTFKHNLS